MKYHDDQEINAVIQRLEDRIRALENSPQVDNTSISGDGSFGAFVDSGYRWLHIGQYVASNLDTDPEENRGIVALAFDEGSGSGYRPFYVSSKFGLSSPAPALPAKKMLSETDYEVTTSASFVHAWRLPVGFLNSNLVYAFCIVVVDSGTTAEYKLAMGGNETDAVEVVGSHSGAITFHWIHEVIPGGLAQIDLHMRRTAGAGNVYAYSPFITMTTENVFIGLSNTDGGAVVS